MKRSLLKQPSKGSGYPQSGPNVPGNTGSASPGTLLVPTLLAPRHRLPTSPLPTRSTPVAPTGVTEFRKRLKASLVWLPALIVLPSALGCFLLARSASQDRYLWTEGRDLVLANLRERVALAQARLGVLTTLVASAQEERIKWVSSTNGLPGLTAGQVWSCPTGVAWSAWLEPVTPPAGSPDDSRTGGLPDLPGWRVRNLARRQVPPGMEPYLRGPMLADTVQRALRFPRMIISAIGPTVYRPEPYEKPEAGWLIALRVEALDGASSPGVLVMAFTGASLAEGWNDLHQFRWVQLQLGNDPDNDWYLKVGSVGGPRSWGTEFLNQLGFPISGESDPIPTFRLTGIGDGPPYRVEARMRARFESSSATLKILATFPLWAGLLTGVGLLLWRLQGFELAARRQNLELRQTQQELTRLDMLRSMIQQELHDHIIQNLTVLALRVSVFNPRQVQDPTQALENLRTILVGQVDYLRGELRKLLFDDPGKIWSAEKAEDRLRASCERYSRDYQARILLTYEVPKMVQFDPEILFRVTRFAEELISNAVRHGGASQVAVNLQSPGPDRVRLIVSDNGKGLPPGGAAAGFGHTNMRKFLKRRNGEFFLGPGPLGGAEVRLEFPLSEPSSRPYPQPATP